MKLMMSPDVKNVIAKHKWTIFDLFICAIVSIFFSSITVHLKFTENEKENKKNDLNSDILTHFILSKRKKNYVILD